MSFRLEIIQEPYLSCKSARWRRRKNTKVVVIARSLATLRIQPDMKSRSEPMDIEYRFKNISIFKAAGTVTPRRTSATIQIAMGMHNLLDNP
jgi:hypothetical protein